MKKIIWFVCIFLILQACTQEKPGVCLSFDDKSIKEWYNIKELLLTYDARVTFFITDFGSLTHSEIQMLNELIIDGHEIGFHGDLHVISENYIKEYSYSKYFENEINNGLKKMNEKGFYANSFAYPYGSKYWFTDLVLLTKFDFTRNVTPKFNERDLTKLDIYYKLSSWDKRVSALELDANANVTFAMLDKAMNRAKKQNEILMLYAHVPVLDTLRKPYTININYLEKVLKMAKQNNLPFLTFNEL